MVLEVSKPVIQFKNMCGHKCSQGVENKCLLQKQSKFLLFFAGWPKFCRQNGPRFGVQKRTPKWRPLVQSQLDLLVSGRLGPRFGVRFWTPKRGPYCRQIFCRRAKNTASFDCFCRYATEVLHTAGPLGFHGFAAPRAIVLHALRTFMPTHVLDLGRPTLATLESTAFFGAWFWGRQRTRFSHAS